MAIAMELTREQLAQEQAATEAVETIYVQAAVLDDTVAVWDQDERHYGLHPNWKEGDNGEVGGAFIVGFKKQPVTVYPVAATPGILKAIKQNRLRQVQAPVTVNPGGRKSEKSTE